jgi:hypothetical protein
VWERRRHRHLDRVAGERVAGSANHDRRFRHDLTGRHPRHAVVGQPGSGTGVVPGPGNAASQANPSATTTSPTAGGGPAVAVNLGGPSLFTPNLQLPSESF